MRVEVRFFAVVRERAGGAEGHTLTLPEGSRLSHLWAALEESHPAVAALRAHVRVAVNLEYAQGDAALAEGDEVALIPPVAGGSPRWTLSERPIDVAAVVRRVERPEAGAVVTFTGVVRNHAQGRAVSSLIYEVYPEMALAKLGEVVGEVEARWPGCRVGVEHRHGRLEVGEVAVVIAVSAAHRAAAFEACQHAIDRIKEIVPIWKKETGPDGTSWVGFGS